MTSESTGSNYSNKNTFDSDSHVQEVKKSYYHIFDDKSVELMKKYFKIEDQNNEVFLRYLKDRRIPTTTPDDV
jgi:hypothetical protein